MSSIGFVATKGRDHAVLTHAGSLLGMGALRKIKLMLGIAEAYHPLYGHYLCESIGARFKFP